MIYTMTLVLFYRIDHGQLSRIDNNISLKYFGYAHETMHNIYACAKSSIVYTYLLLFSAYYSSNVNIVTIASRTYYVRIRKH